MSNKSDSSSGGFGIVTVGSGIYAYATTAAFTGLKGIFASAVVGMGTSFIAGLYGIGGAAVAGAAVGGLAMLAKSRSAGEIAIAAAVVGGLASGAYGIYKGYGFTHDMILNGVKGGEESIQIDDQASVSNKAVSSYTFG